MEENKRAPKQKRHFILLVLLISLGLMLGGEMLGELLVLPLRNLLPERYVGFRFRFCSTARRQKRRSSAASARKSAAAAAATPQRCSRSGW